MDIDEFEKIIYTIELSENLLVAYMNEYMNEDRSKDDNEVTKI